MKLIQNTILINNNVERVEIILEFLNFRENLL